MRDALEHLAEIESYILGTHPNRPAFEQRLQTDTELRLDTNRIRQLVGAIRAQGIKQEIRRARTNRALNRWLKMLAIIAFTLTVALAATMAYNHYADSNNNRHTSESDNAEIDTHSGIQALDSARLILPQRLQPQVEPMQDSAIREAGHTESEGVNFDSSSTGLIAYPPK